VPRLTTARARRGTPGKKAAPRALPDGQVVAGPLQGAAVERRNLQSSFTGLPDEVAFTVTFAGLP
jgi:hypothetical protein